MEEQNKDEEQIREGRQMWARLLKSSQCLLWYLKKSGRVVGSDKNNALYAECPTLDCHCVSDADKFHISESDLNAMSADEREAHKKAELSARMFEASGDAAAYVKCECCHSPYTIVELYQADNNCDEQTAYNNLFRDLMNALPKMLLDGGSIIDEHGKRLF